MAEATLETTEVCTCDIKIKGKSANIFWIRVPSRGVNLTDDERLEITELFRSLKFADVVVFDHFDGRISITAYWDYPFPASLVPQIPYRGAFVEILRYESHEMPPDEPVGYLSTLEQIISNNPGLLAGLVVFVVMCISLALRFLRGR